jgi:hypothetical protein
MTTTTTPTTRYTDDGRPVAIEPAGLTPYELKREITRRIEALDRETDSRYALEYVSAFPLAEYEKHNHPIAAGYRWIIVWPVTGGSEGHYIHVEAVHQYDADRRPLDENKHVPLLLIKIFGGWDAAADLAGIIGRWLGA